jgi:hypothetical protein
MPPTDHDRLVAYAERFFQRHAKTEFPTVRAAARALRWNQQRIEDAVDGDPDGRLMLTGFNLTNRRGDLFVETMV